jgi:hypothetical protein
MRRSDAYAVLVKELEAIRQLSVPDLLALVGAPPIERTSYISGETIELELSVSWRDNTHQSVLVIGHARGPSTWLTERLKESITVPVLSGKVDGT